MKFAMYTLCFLLCLGTTADSRKNLVCHKWKQIGLKPFGKTFTPVNASLAEILTLKTDGTYEELLNGNLQIGGVWKFDADSAKLAFAITSMAGVPMTNLPLEKTKPTDSILRLTADTLIYGSLAYYGPEKIYGHDDWYFVRDGN